MRSKSGFFGICAIFTCLLLAACAEKPVAPVIERAPASTPQQTPRVKAEAVRSKEAEKDWRPDTHTVKKGDTLFSLGLQYGEDYKEIARINQIPAPYVIRINQVLKLRETAGEALSEKSAGKSETPQQYPAASSGETVILAPQRTESVAPVTQNDTPLQINRPKAMREPYSDKALATTNPSLNTDKVAKASPEVTVANQAEPAKNNTNKGDTAVSSQPPRSVEPGSGGSVSADPDPAASTGAGKSTPEASPNANTTPLKTTALEEENIEWLWPTAGKLLANFNDGSSKGIDIAGNSGQAVQAAARGKVIYAGSDLRGYGKLVIIKHSKNYLSVYAHNKQILVKEGQAVQKGQKISEMGNTDTDTTKLHFEIRYQGRSVDPAKYLPNNPNP